MPRGEPRDLSSWKDIAAYLGVSVRTAQKWEAERALPVNRLGSPHGRVSVTTAELDQWKLVNLHGPSRFASPRFLRWYAAGVTIAGIIGTLLFVFHRTETATQRPSSYRLESGRLAVLDTRGETAWTAAFPDLASPENYACYENVHGRMIWFGDLDGDGETEVLFNHVPRAGIGARPGPLICYSQKGREKWRYRPGRAVATASATYDDAFQVFSFAVAQVDGHNMVAVSAGHQLHFPAEIVLLDANGKAVREYWHPGHLPHVITADLDGDGTTEILATGINNARRMGTLIVLDPRTLGGSATEPAAPNYQFIGYPAAIESTRIFFPRTCLTDLDDVWNAAGRIDLNGSRITVGVLENPHGEPGSVYYDFDYRLKLLHVTLDDSFLILHKKLFRAGRIDHEVSDAEIAKLSPLQ